MNWELLYGRQPVLEALRASRREMRVLRVAGSVQLTGVAAEILRLAEQRGLRLERCETRDMDRLTHAGHHQGVALEVGPYSYAPWEEMTRPTAEGEPPFLLLLDHIQDPQNLGSILRTAEAAGAHGALIPKDRAAEITPAVVRASAGACEHLRVARVVNLAEAMRRLKEMGVWLTGLHPFPEAAPYTALDYRDAVGLVIGGEGEGLTRLVRARCDHLARIPMRGRVGSLNAAAAAAVMMYEVRRQRTPEWHSE